MDATVTTFTDADGWNRALYALSMVPAPPPSR
jgi:hypothetical protein